MRGRVYGPTTGKKDEPECWLQGGLVKWTWWRYYGGRVVTTEHAILAAAAAVTTTTTTTLHRHQLHSTWPYLLERRYF